MRGEGVSFGQVKMPTLLALDAADSAIGGSLVGLPVQRHPDRETARRVVSNDLNAANGFASGPVSDGLQALFSESPVAHSDCFHRLRHACFIQAGTVFGQKMTVAAG
jgi:hypothetical protein